MDSLENKNLVSRMGMPPEEEESITRACASNDFGILRNGASEEFATELTDERIRSFVGLLEGKPVDNGDVVALGNILRQYGASNEEPKVLNAKEVEVVNLGINYISEWCKAGGLEAIARDNDTPNKDMSMNLGTLAYIVNQLAKVKTLNHARAITDLDVNFLSDLLNKGRSASKEFLNEKRLADSITALETRLATSRLDSTAATKESKKMEADRDKYIQIFRKSLRSKLLSMQTSQTQEIVGALVNALESDDVVIEMVPKISGEGYSVAEAWNLVLKETQDEKGLAKLTHLVQVSIKMDAQTRAEILKITNVQLSAVTKMRIEFHELQNSIVTIDAKGKQRAYEEASNTLTAQIMSLRYKLSSTKQNKELLNGSFDAVDYSLEKGRSGDLYVLKCLLASIEIARREYRDKKDIDLDSIELLRDERGGGHVFSFNESDSTPDSAWYKIHVPKRQMPALRLVAEALINGKSTN
jgi:hypothetical protein